MPSVVVNTMDNASCPVVSGTPKVIRAAFSKETDFFGERGITYLDTAITMTEPLMCKQQMLDEFGPLLGITRDENDFAIEQAFKALEEFDRRDAAQGQGDPRRGRPARTASPC